EAEEAMRTNTFKVCVVDHMLPGKERGLDFVSKHAGLQTSFLFLTAFPTAELFKQAWALGVNETFKKPVNLDLLVDSIMIASQLGPSSSFTGHLDPDTILQQSESDQSTYPRLFEPTLKEMISSLGPDLPINLLQQLREQCLADCQAILDSKSHQDFVSAKSHSHRIAGALINFGLQRAEMLARSVFNSAEEENQSTWTLAQELFDELDPSLKKAGEYLKAG
ncbi:MAG: hypothetical protein AAF202_10110, partial [Pseudomonadota bacterium]